MYFFYFFYFFFVLYSFFKFCFILLILLFKSDSIYSIFLFLTLFPVLCSDIIHATLISRFSLFSSLPLCTSSPFHLFNSSHFLFFLVPCLALLLSSYIYIPLP